jgi:hypothetical protein
VGAGFLLRYGIHFRVVKTRTEVEVLLSNLPGHGDENEMWHDIKKRVGEYADALLAALNPDGANRKALRKASANDPRDKFCYDSLKKRKSLKWIKDALSKRSQWEPLSTTQGISQAAKRYADRHSLPWPA